MKKKNRIASKEEEYVGSVTAEKEFALIKAAETEDALQKFVQKEAEEKKKIKCCSKRRITYYCLERIIRLKSF